ncbi:MAG: CoA-binding protein [Ilumatobacteraceae bacterium]
MHPHSHNARRPAVALAAGLMAASALVGGAGLIGGFIDIGHRLNSRLPFSSPVFGGIALAVVVGIPFVVLAKYAWRGDRRSGEAALVAGTLLVGWIVIELAFIREVSFLHPLCAVAGAAFAVVGSLTRGGADHVVDRAAVARFLAAPRIALVGASSDPKKFGNSVFRALRDHGYDVVPVNPGAAEIEGVPCVATVADLDSDVDAAMVMLTGDAAVEAVNNCAARGVRAVWLFRGIGSPGAVSDASVEACHQHSLDVVVGACPLMFLEPVASAHKVHLAVRRYNRAFAEVG